MNRDSTLKRIARTRVDISHADMLLSDGIKGIEGVLRALYDSGNEPMAWRVSCQLYSLRDALEYIKRIEDTVGGR